MTVRFQRHAVVTPPLSHTLATQMQETQEAANWHSSKGENIMIVEELIQNSRTGKKIIYWYVLIYKKNTFKILIDKKNICSDTKYDY